jgi:hypothetical protein
MSNKPYVDSDGNYVGSYPDNHSLIPAGAVSVPSYPKHGLDKWVNGAWDESPRFKDELATYRWEKEVGGINYGGLPIATDDRSKLMINGAYNKAIDEADPTATRKFKATGGFVTVDNATIIAVALAVADHVQKCFDAEEIVYNNIESNMYTTVQEVKDAFDTAYAGL